MFWHKLAIPLHQQKNRAMLQIVISVALYVGALVLLVKGAFAYCNHHQDNVVTEP